MLTEKLKYLQSELAVMKTTIDLMERSIAEAKQSWPDHQVVTDGVEWHSCEEVPPKGMIWASDGINVWMILADGPIPETATLVKYWTNAWIPAPPDFMETAEKS